MKKKLDNKKLIGRKDKVDFPKMRLYDIDAKIDTGAYTSAIHCHNIKISEKDNVKYVTFNLLDPSHPDFNEKRFRVPLHAKKRIKSSIGKSEERCIIKTSITLFGEKFEIELSLSDRSKMENPVLIGRKLLKKGFIVDVSKSDLSYKQKVNRRKK
ncbi:MAG: ribosomal protein S6 modification protein [Thermodesulfobacteriota bacterium]|nr:MAG: ribosomal protein S6 modification protein [Thermodesulfobacteriota bacterium]